MLWFIWLSIRQFSLSPQFSPIFFIPLLLFKSLCERKLKNRLCWSGVCWLSLIVIGTHFHEFPGKGNFPTIFHFFSHHAELECFPLLSDYYNALKRWTKQSNSEAAEFELSFRYYPCFSPRFGMQSELWESRKMFHNAEIIGRDAIKFWRRWQKKTRRTCCRDNLTTRLNHIAYIFVVAYKNFLVFSNFYEN